MRKHDRKRPCKPEDGYHKCRAVKGYNIYNITIGDEVCAFRQFVYDICGVILKCTDDEVQCDKR